MQREVLERRGERAKGVCHRRDFQVVVPGKLPKKGIGTQLGRTDQGNDLLKSHIEGPFC